MSTHAAFKAMGNDDLHKEMGQIQKIQNLNLEKPKVERRGSVIKETERRKEIGQRNWMFQKLNWFSWMGQTEIQLQMVDVI